MNNNEIEAFLTDNYYVNSNNVFISYEVYDKMINIGYTPKEIEIMNYREYKKICDMDFYRHIRAILKPKLLK